MSVIWLSLLLAQLRGWRLTARRAEEHPAGEVHPARLQAIRERCFQRLGVGCAGSRLRVAFPGLAHIGHRRVVGRPICRQVMADQNRVELRLDQYFDGLALIHGRVARSHFRKAYC
jgi:hypothetical protein